MKNFKRVISVAMVAAMVVSVFACSSETAETEAEIVTNGISYAEYVAADLDTEVTVDVYVQATQSWWNDSITVYAADQDGAYFIYGMACSEEEAALLESGTMIEVTGYKTEWSGEIEIADATFTVVEGADTYIAYPIDLTADFGNEDALIENQNAFFSMDNLTVVESADGAAFLYSWDGSGSQGDDLYFTVSNGDATATFTVESYLTGADTAVYQTVEGLQVGDTINVAGFLYWYEGVNPHITFVEVQ